MEDLPPQIRQALNDMNWEDRLEKARAQREKVLRARKQGENAHMPVPPGAPAPHAAPKPDRTPPGTSLTIRPPAPGRKKAPSRNRLRIASVATGICAGLIAASALFTPAPQSMSSALIVSDVASPQAAADAPLAERRGRDVALPRATTAAAATGAPTAADGPAVQAVLTAPILAAPATAPETLDPSRASRTDTVPRMARPAPLPVLASPTGHPERPAFSGPQRPRAVVVRAALRTPTADAPDAGTRRSTLFPGPTPPRTSPVRPDPLTGHAAAPAAPTAPPPLLPGASDVAVAIFASPLADPDRVADVADTVSHLGFWTGPVRWVTYDIPETQVHVYDAKSAKAARALAARIGAAPRDFSTPGTEPLHDGFVVVLLGETAGSPSPGPVASARGRVGSGSGEGG